VAAGDTRSDLYFLGCVGYELLTGRSPLEMCKDPRARMQRERFMDIKPIDPEEIKGPPSVIRLIENMMSLNPHERFQTPSQLLDAIREVRREVEGKASQESRKHGPRTLFLAEKDERLQDVLREKLKEAGFRVLIAADPVRALDRFRQQPFDILIVDAGTTGENGMLIFEKIMNDAARHKLHVHGILLLNEDQAGWVAKVVERPTVEVLVQPVKLKQLLRKLHDLNGAV
jgi:CheY-like chemotaxis protein